jgi:squalene synthase HpnC
VSRFVPANLRRFVWAIYAFARSADDFADEARFAGQRKQALAKWEELLERAFHGEAEHPIFVALAETVERCEIPITPLQDLLTAFSMDIGVSRYATFKHLERYMATSAHPVGRLALYVFGYRDPALHRYSDDLCTAVQLTQMVQDVGRALAKDRIYLPQEDLAHFGVSEETLYRRQMTSELEHLLRFEVARARSLFERGRPLIDEVGPDLGFELAMLWTGGNLLLDKIEAASFDVFRRRPRLSSTDKAKMIAKAATLRWPAFSAKR